MDRLKHMKETLTCFIENQMSHLEQVDTKELGEAIDMIKDLEEAIYYCTITEAMHKTEKHSQWQERDMDRHQGRMYYPYREPMCYEEDYTGYFNGDNRHREFYEKETPMEVSDYREGRSPKNRRMYMEAKETHQDKVTQMRELEKYMQELT
jgi:hypothetical protein